MPRPTRTIDDLIGKQVWVSEKHLIPKARQHNRFLVHKTCKVVSVKQDRSGRITHLYVLREKERRYRNNRFKVVKWLKTKKRIPAEYCTETVRRIRRKGDAKFKWMMPQSFGTVTIKAGVQWEGGQAPLAWWINDQNLMPYGKDKRIDENKAAA